MLNAVLLAIYKEIDKPSPMIDHVLDNEIFVYILISL